MAFAPNIFRAMLADKAHTLDDRRDAIAGD